RRDPRGDGARDRARRLLGRRRRPAARGQLPDHARREREALPLPRRLPDAVIEPIRREAARVAVIDGELRILLLHTRDPAGAGEWWELPGGGLAPGEIPSRAARRELYEETGIVAEELGPRLAVVETDFSFDG